MRMNINNLLKLNIKGKLGIAFAGLAIFPVLVVGILGIGTNVRTLRQAAIDNLNRDLSTIKERASTFLGGIEENIEFLTASSSFQQFIDAVNSRDPLRVSQSKEDLLRDLLNFAERKQVFYQITFIDRRGDEIFSIEQSLQHYRTVSEQELNISGTSFYMYLAGEISRQKATFIPVELIRKDSKTLVPGISCIYPIYTQNFVGLLIFQIYAQKFFKIMEQETPLSPPGKVMLVNSDGFYLYHSEKKKDWNQLLASKDILNLKSDYGERMAMRLLANSSGHSFFEIDGEIVAHLPLFDGHKGLESMYTILKSVSKEKIFAPAETFMIIFFGLLGFFLVLSLFLAYLATQQFTRSIQRLRREAEVIAQGNYHSRVDVHTHDEIEDLAHQFNVMAESLQERDTEIARHRGHLEQMVQDRTGELRKEKDKLQAILDNVPSGFILLDKKFRILSASAALEAITGKSVKRLLGRLCYDAIGNDFVCPGCPTHQVFRTGKMISHVVHRLGAEGEERYLEHISVPLKKDGRVENILEIITDVTDRKRLQDQLIRSERLAATGEIAAVIAHEMRNSLTSVRMILQLLNETEQLVPSDRESLDVALDSLGRMERVVKDLLQLARPSRLEKRRESINEILQESIAFAEHQMAHKEIKLDVKLAAHLPDTELDHEHMKEAVVNLILNASQAIEARGMIEIRSELTTIKKNLRDLGEVRVAADEKVTVGVQEVVLKKGTRTIKVEVEDSGCGIPEEHLNRIFDPFFTTKVNGTGLGLSFVKRIVNEHSGIVTAESKVGRGSRFSILIPVNNQAQRVKSEA